MIDELPQNQLGLVTPKQFHVSVVNANAATGMSLHPADRPSSLRPFARYSKSHSIWTRPVDQALALDDWTAERFWQQDIPHASWRRQVNVESNKVGAPGSLS